MYPLYWGIDVNTRNGNQFSLDLLALCEIYS